MALAVLGFAFYEIPQLLVTSSDVPRAAKRLELQNDVRTATAQLLAGVVLALGLIYTARTFRVTREGQIAERFSRAIDQLGNKRLDIRLGGIYSLERLASDSERDRRPVIEVLSAYARRYRREGEEATQKAAPQDIEAIVRVLGRQDPKARVPFNLAGADLRHVQFPSGGNFSNTDMSEVKLAGAKLVSISMRNALLYDADFGDAALYGVDLNNARLNNADLSQVRPLHVLLGGAKRKWAGAKWPDRFDPEAVRARQEDR